MKPVAQLWPWPGCLVAAVSRYSFGKRFLNTRVSQPQPVASILNHVARTTPIKSKPKKTSSSPILSPSPMTATESEGKEAHPPLSPNSARSRPCSWTVGEHSLIYIHTEVHERRFFLWTYTLPLSIPFFQIIDQLSFPKPTLPSTTAITTSTPSSKKCPANPASSTPFPPTGPSPWK